MCIRRPRRLTAGTFHAYSALTFCPIPLRRARLTTLPGSERRTFARLDRDYTFAMATTSGAAPLVLAQWTVADLKQTTTSVNKKDFAFLSSYNWSEGKLNDSTIIVPG